MAIKVLDKAKIRANNMGEQIKKEISIMKLIKHPAVIQLIEVLASTTTIYIVLELVTGGELFDKIIEEGCFAEDEAREYFTQLMEGIAHCHSSGVVSVTVTRLPSNECALHEVWSASIALSSRVLAFQVHRDLKPENLLLDSAGRLKVSCAHNHDCT